MIFYIKRISAILCSVALGLIFLYSGYTKLLPVIETFEFTFVDLGIGNWYTAPVIARLLIGLEFFTGVLLILNFNLKRFVIPLTVSLLVFFILYLSASILLNGNSGNCGCFGEHIRMTPLQAIYKNLGMLAMAFYVYFLYPGWTMSYKRLFTSFIGITACILPFLVNPIDFNYSSNNLDEKVNYPLELNLLYQPEDSGKVEVPTVDLRQGKHVLAMLSLSCPHCRVAAKKFRLIKKNNPELSIYFILNGDRELYRSFIEDTKADNIPSSFCLGKSFVRLASSQLPRIYYLDDGIVKRKVDYFELNQYEIESWIASGKN